MSPIKKYLKQTLILTILLLSLPFSKEKTISESQTYINTLPTNQTSISSLIWSRESIGNPLDISISHKDLIFIYTSTGILYVLSKETGQIQNIKNYLIENSSQIQIESSNHVLIKLNLQVGEIEVMKSLTLQSLSVLSIDDHMKNEVKYSRISIESRSVIDYSSVIILDRSVYYINNNEILGRYQLNNEESLVVDSFVSYISRSEIEVSLIVKESSKESTSTSYLKLKILSLNEKDGKNEGNEGKVSINLVENELIQENYHQNEFYIKNFKKRELRKENLCNGYDITTISNSNPNPNENETIQYCKHNYLSFKSPSKNITWTKDISYSNLVFFKLFSVQSEELISEQENYSHYQIIRKGIKADFLLKSIRNVITSFNYLIKSIKIRINSIFTGKTQENLKKNSLNQYLLLQKNEIEEVTSINSQNQKNVFIINVQTGEELYSFYEKRPIIHMEILSNSEISLKFQEKSYEILVNLTKKSHSDSSHHEEKGVFTVISYENNSILKGISQNNKGNQYIKWQIRRENIIFKLLPNINKHSLVHLPSNGNIFSKILNNNLLFTISKANSDILIIELLDGLMGSVLYKTDLKKVDFSKKILPIYKENLLLIAYTYKDKNTLRQEVASFELMSKKAEVSFPLFFEKLFFGDFNENPQKDSFFIKEKLIVLTQTYTLESSIKSMYITNSCYSVANKNLVLVTLNNKIILMDIRTFSSRRPILNTQEEGNISSKDLLSSENHVSYSFFIDNDLPVYSPLVRLDEKRLLNQNYLYEQVDFIDLSSTTYESTLVLCSKGSRISCYFVYPDKTFDSLPNSFMFELIVVFLVLIYIVAFSLRSFVKKEIFIESWKNSR